MSLKIIRSMGIQRGKNDKIDAKRIAQYAMRNVKDAVLFKAPSETLVKIRRLLSLRDKLITTKVGLMKLQKELKSFDKPLAKLTLKCQANTIKGILKDLVNIEKQISQLVKNDERINSLFEIITSIPGIGKITALFLICFTNEFTMFSTPRQLCYCGVVPFEYTSGKSIKGRPKVHHMANKKMKKQLHMCALAAVTYDSEMKNYYQKKVAEGKAKMLVLNNVRNKLVHRVCACIRENRVYQLRKTA